MTFAIKRKTRDEGITERQTMNGRDVIGAMGMGSELADLTRTRRTQNEFGDMVVELGNTMVILGRSTYCSTNKHRPQRSDNLQSINNRGRGNNRVQHRGQRS
jgi:hypothetical protein